MRPYSGRFAELYDIFYEDKPYDAEAKFVDSCLRAYSIGDTHRILELACGTGQHAFRLEKLGYEIVATDYSEDMLRHAKRKAALLSSKVDFRLHDMRNIDLPDDPFDAVICLFDSIGYVLTNQALIETLKGVHRHLRPNGLFVFEFWHASAMLRSFEPLRIGRWSTSEGEVLRVSKTSLRYAEQIAIVDYDIFELRDSGIYAVYRETHANRYFLLQEMAGWLAAAGFSPLKWFCGYANDESITEHTWHILAVARRNAHCSLGSTQVDVLPM